MKENEIESIVKIINIAREPHVNILLQDLNMLVKFAVLHDEISVSKAGELLGMNGAEMHQLMKAWEAKN